MLRSWRWHLLAFVIGVLTFGPALTAQRFSAWSAPANLGSLVNSTAFDG